MGSSGPSGDVGHIKSIKARRASLQLEAKPPEWQYFQSHPLTGSTAGGVLTTGGNTFAITNNAVSGATNTVFNASSLINGQ